MNDRIEFYDRKGAIVSEQSFPSVEDYMPEGVHAEDVRTVRALWTEVRAHLYPHTEWRWDEALPVLGAMSRVLTGRRAELCPPTEAERVDALARLLAQHVEGADPDAEDWPAWVAHFGPLAARLAEVHEPEVTRLRAVVRRLGRDYGRASAEIGAQRGMLARAIEQRKAAGQDAGRAHAEVTAARTRIRMLLGVADSPDLGALTLAELIDRLVDHLGRPGAAEADQAQPGVVDRLGDARELRDALGSVAQALSVDRDAPAAELAAGAVEAVRRLTFRASLVRHHGTVALAADFTFAARCTRCDRVTGGHPDKVAGWVDLDQHWYGCRPTMPVSAHDHRIVPRARVRWTIGGPEDPRAVTLTGTVEHLVPGLAVVVPDGTAVTTRWGLPTRLLTVVTDEDAPGGDVDG